MAITTVGFDTNTNAGDVTITLPAHQIDDVAFIWASCESTATVSITGASGWTKLVQSNFTVVFGGEDAGVIFYKRLTSSSESNPTLTQGLTQDIVAGVRIFRGVDSSIFDTSYTSTTYSGSVSSINHDLQSYSIKTVTDNSALFYVWLTSSNNTLATFTFASPSGYTAGEFDKISTAGTSQGFEGYNIGITPAGIYTPGVWTTTHSASVELYGLGFSLALKIDPAFVAPVEEEEVTTVVEVSTGISKIDNHVELALSSLIEQYKDSTNLKALLSTFVSRDQGFEDVAWDVLTDRGISTAVGQQLDDIGIVVNQPREGVDDEVYRVRLRARIKTNISAGTVEDLITILSLITETTIQVLDDGLASASILIKSSSITNEVALISGQFSNDAKPLSIDLTITWKQQDKPMFSMGISTHLSSSTLASGTLLPASYIPAEFPSQGTLTIGKGLATEEDIGYSSFSANGFTVSGTVPFYAHGVREALTLKRDNRGFAQQKLNIPTVESELNVALGISATPSYAYLWADTIASPLVDKFNSIELDEFESANINYSVQPKGYDITSTYIEQDAGFRASSTAVADVGAADNVAFIWVGQPAQDGADGTYLGKDQGATYYLMDTDFGIPQTRISVSDGTDTTQSIISEHFEDKTPLALMGVLDRSANELRLYAWQDGVTYSGTVGDATLIGSLSNAGDLEIGSVDFEFCTKGYYFMTSIFESTDVPNLDGSSLRSLVNYMGLDTVEEINNGVLSSALMIKSTSEDKSYKSTAGVISHPTQVELITPNTTDIRYPNYTEFNRIMGTTVSGLWYTETLTTADRGGNTNYTLTSSGTINVQFVAELNSPVNTSSSNSVKGIAASSSTYFTPSTSFIDVWAGTISGPGTGLDPTSTDDTLGIIGKSDSSNVGRSIVCGADFITAEIKGTLNGESTNQIEVVSNIAGRTFFDGTPIIIASVYEASRFRLYVWSNGIVHTSEGSVPLGIDFSNNAVFKAGNVGNKNAAGTNTVMLSTSVDTSISSFDYTTLSYLATYLRFQ
jgi:hypothetical protein